MDIYHALINTLSTHVIHINLTMIFYTHVERSPTKTVYIVYYTEEGEEEKSALHTHAHTHTDCSRNCVLILVGWKYCEKRKVFSLALKKWQGWTVSQVLWECVPNVGSKEREGVKATSLAFVLLDLYVLIIVPPGKILHCKNASVMWLYPCLMMCALWVGVLNTGNVHYCMVYADRYIFARIVQAVVVKFGKCFFSNSRVLLLAFSLHSSIACWENW